jgi:hypothetical protein
MVEWWQSILVNEVCQTRTAECETSSEHPHQRR